MSTVFMILYIDKKNNGQVESLKDAEWITLWS